MVSDVAFDGLIQVGRLKENCGPALKSMKIRFSANAKFEILWEVFGSICDCFCTFDDGQEFPFNYQLGSLDDLVSEFVCMCHATSKIVEVVLLANSVNEASSDLQIVLNCLDNLSLSYTAESNGNETSHNDNFYLIL